MDQSHLSHLELVPHLVSPALPESHTTSHPRSLARPRHPLQQLAPKLLLSLPYQQLAPILYHQALPCTPPLTQTTSLRLSLSLLLHRQPRHLRLLHPLLFQQLWRVTMLIPHPSLQPPLPRPQLPLFHLTQQPSQLVLLQPLPPPEQLLELVALPTHPALPLLLITNVVESTGLDLPPVLKVLIANTRTHSTTNVSTNLRCLECKGSLVDMTAGRYRVWIILMDNWVEVQFLFYLTVAFLQINMIFPHTSDVSLPYPCFNHESMDNSIKFFPDKTNHPNQDWLSSIDVSLRSTSRIHQICPKYSLHNLTNQKGTHKSHIDCPCKFRAKNILIRRNLSEHRAVVYTGSLTTADPHHISLRCQLCALFSTSSKTFL